MDSVIERSKYRINQKIEALNFAKGYRQDRFVHIENFLRTTDAESLYRYMDREQRWRSFLVAKEELFEAEADGISDGGGNHEMVDAALEGARSGFAAFFEASRWISDELCGDLSALSSIEIAIEEFVNSSGFLDLCREIAGVSELCRADAQLVRFKAGHFVTYNGAIPTSEDAAKRRLAYSINLTPEWKPEWGGLLEFRRQEGYLIEAVQPCFNALDLFDYPRGYWVSSVTSFCGG